MVEIGLLGRRLGCGVVRGRVTAAHYVLEYLQTVLVVLANDIQNNGLVLIQHSDRILRVFQDLKHLLKLFLPDFLLKEV